MDEKSQLLTISQFAKLSGISRPNLIFYEKENLIKPVSVKENGYRMYDYKQINLAYKITTFRKMGLSLAQIRQYLNDFSDLSTLEMMNTQIRELDAQIQELQQQKYNLQIYKKCIEKYADHTTNGTFSIEHMDEESLFICPSLESQQGKATTMNEFLMYCRNTGIRIDCHIGRIFSNAATLSAENDFRMADYIFFKKLHGNHTKPEGNYLVYTNMTDGSTIDNLYTDFFTYINKMNLIVTGNIYEDYPLSGIFSSDRELHFIRICVKLITKFHCHNRHSGTEFCQI